MANFIIKFTIGDLIKNTTNKKKFLFGYEESYGYLLGEFTRDKDAIQAAVLISEVALFYKEQQRTLWDGLDDIYKEYGYYGDCLETKELNGEIGQKKINQMIDNLRGNPIDHVGDHYVKTIEDFELQKVMNGNLKKERDINLPKSNVIKYVFDDEYWFAVRPSGTEPKIKIYFGNVESTKVSGEKELEEFTQLVKKIVYMED